MIYERRGPSQGNCAIIKGEGVAAAAIVEAIEQVLAEAKLRTRDLGGPAGTATCGKAVADALR